MDCMAATDLSLDCDNVSSWWSNVMSRHEASTPSFLDFAPAALDFEVDEDFWSPPLGLGLVELVFFEDLDVFVFLKMRVTIDIFGIREEGIENENGRPRWNIQTFQKWPENDSHSHSNAIAVRLTRFDFFIDSNSQRIANPRPKIFDFWIALVVIHSVDRDVHEYPVDFDMHLNSEASILFTALLAASSSIEGVSYQFDSPFSTSTSRRCRSITTSCRSTATAW